MAQRHQIDPATRPRDRKSEQPKRPPAGTDPSRERGAEKDSGRSWVHDEPPLKQEDEPKHSGYSDRETPESNDPGSRPARPSERPRNER